MNTIEQKIIALLKAGDRKAISLLYDHYADTLFGVIKNIVKDDAHAQDVLQDSFVKYWKHSKTYDPKKAGLFAWLLRIARNTAIDKYRSINSRNTKEIRTNEYSVHIKNRDTFRPELMDVQNHVGNLELKYQKVINALYFKGMTQIEASEFLDIPLGTVKTRLRNGLKQLRKVFGKQEYVIAILIYILS